MRLEHISFQRRGANHKMPFSQLYKRWFSHCMEERSPYAAVISAMEELLRHLETEVDAPPCRVFTSHFTVVFSRQDVSTYGQGQASDFLFEVNYGYGVPDGSCWNIPAFVINDFNRKRHQLTTVDEAVETIALILRHAEFFGMDEEGENSPAKLKA